MSEAPHRERFIGTWMLVSQEAQHPGARAVPSRGDSPLGILMYDASGNMAVQLMRTDARATDYRDMAELDTAMSGYLSYFGRYEVDEAAGVVRHLVRGSSYFGYRGATLTREYTFDGDTLTLRARAADGRAWRVLIWRRAA